MRLAELKATPDANHENAHPIHDWSGQLCNQHRAPSPARGSGFKAELSQLWKKLVKLYHPDRFANEPEKLDAYHKLTAAINQAKDNSDIELLREIAEDPNGFTMRRGWANLDFKDVEELAQLKRLQETLQKEIAAVTASLKQLRESPDYELCQLAEQKPGVLDELAAERVKLLAKENAELETQASQLAQAIKELSGQSVNRII